MVDLVLTSSRPVYCKLRTVDEDPEDFRSKKFREIMLRYATIAILRGCRFRGTFREFPTDLYGDDVFTLAEDLVQETFVKIEAKKEQEVKNGWTAFILGVITEQVMTVRKKVLRHPSPMPVSRIDGDSSDGGTVWEDLEIPDTAKVSPEQILIDEELRAAEERKVAEAKKQLKQRYLAHIGAKIESLCGKTFN